MSFPVGPKIYQSITAFTEGVSSQGKKLWSIIKNAFQKPDVPTKPLTGYPLVESTKTKKRKHVFKAMQEAKGAGKIYAQIVMNSSSIFHAKLTALHDVLSQRPPLNYKEANKQAIKLIREAVSSEEYKKNCTNEFDPGIRYLHRIVLASFVDYRPLDDFEKVMQPLRQEGYTADTLARRVTEARDRGQAEHRLIKNDTSVGYFTRYTALAFSALKSEKVIPGLVYDPKLGEESYSGSISEEEITLQDQSTRKLQAFITATPTVGDEVAPEAIALLHALENRRKMSPEELKKDDYPFTHWTYTSFQDIQAQNEGARARAIMQLQDRFPDTFTGITISLDTPFFTDGVQGKNEEEILLQKRENGEQGLTDEYAEKMAWELHNNLKYCLPENMPLEDIQTIVQMAKKTVLGAHSPESGKREISVKKTKTSWVEKTGNKVRAFFSDQPQLQKTSAGYVDLHEMNWEQKAAFRELVVLGLIRYAELKTAPETGTGLVCRACKTSVDRGAQVNSAYMWAMGDGSDRSSDTAFNLVLGKALVDRGRSILLARLEPALALWKSVSQKNAHEFLMRIPFGEGVESTYTPMSKTPDAPKASGK